VRPSRTQRNSSVIFDSAFGIGFFPQIEDIHPDSGMKPSKNISNGRRPTVKESDLRDREARLRAILDTAVEGIITIDERGSIESFNAASEKIFGYTADEVIGKNVNVLMSTPHRERHDGYLENYKHTGHARIIGIGRETIAKRKDGTLFPIDLSVSEVKLSDRRIFTGFVRDVSERKRLEREILEISEREQRRIGQDLHDGLCQHLAGIEMLSQVLAQKLEPKFKAAAGRAHEIAKAVRAGISQTRLLAGGLSPVTLEAEGLMAALAELALNTEKMFGVNCHLICPAVVKFDNYAAATHLFRIAQEAVSNAIKHGKANKISIQLTEDASHIRLRVDDNGKGFPEKFTGGSGMGLRIMQSRIGMVGGSLSIEQRPTGGASVIFSAPKD
jgi:two-component system CheB/CheR fusion protein